MDTRIIKPLTALTCVLSLLLSGAASADRGDSHRNKHEQRHITILQVNVDYQSNEIYITGQNLKRGRHDTRVRLADTELTVLTAEENFVSAALPAGLESGDYRLQVSTGRGRDHASNYDLTLGQNLGSAESRYRVLTTTATLNNQGFTDVPTAECAADEFAIASSHSFNDREAGLLIRLVRFAYISSEQLNPRQWNLRFYTPYSFALAPEITVSVTCAR